MGYVQVEHQKTPSISAGLSSNPGLACDMAKVSDIFLMYSMLAQCTYKNSIERGKR